MLTMLVEQQNQVLSAVGADVEEQSRTLASPEAQGDIFCSQGQVRVDRGGQDAAAAAAPVQLVQHRLLEGVADRCS